MTVHVTPSLKTAYWVCGCASDNGEHLNAALYSGCVFCGQRRSGPHNILAPLPAGGMGCVAILGLAGTRAFVQTVSFMDTGMGASIDNAKAPQAFWVEQERIERRSPAHHQVHPLRA